MNIRTAAIVGNGPPELIPDLGGIANEIDIWIGADRGALTIINHNIRPDVAIGDFDSTSNEEKKRIQQQSVRYATFPSEKDYTDLELALFEAFRFNPDKIYLFGTTGGRLDHTLINIQLLYHIAKKNILGIMIDKNNQLRLTLPGRHTIHQDNMFSHISFIPYSRYVSGLTLRGFYYTLTNETISWGSTLSISNKLLSNYGTFSYHEGILLVVKSRDGLSKAISTRARL
ncbi:MAG TPA: thiamine diphosphokinase [Bacillota bacterium]|nr:thiamine diphosphokinase [Bacillota bacterium]